MNRARRHQFDCLVKKNRPTYVKLFIWMKNGCPTLAFIQDVLLLIDSSVKNKFIVPNFSEGMII